MKQTKGAIGNLLNRYRAVLKKCHLLNTFGSLAVASMLVMGGAGSALAVDEVLGGKRTPAETGDVNHLVGGWLYEAGTLSPEDPAPSTGDLTLTVTGSNKISEIIAGSYLRQENPRVTEVTHGDITTTIARNDTAETTEFVVGGSKLANDADGTLSTGHVILNIQSGTFGDEDGTEYSLVVGGNYVKTNTSNDNSATTQGSEVNVSGGTFYATVVGGSVAHNYRSNTPSVTDTGNTSVLIEGGTFKPSKMNKDTIEITKGDINLSAAVIGGNMALAGGSALVKGNTSVLINGEAVIDGKVVAGSVAVGQPEAVAGAEPTTATVAGSTSLTMNAGTVNNDLVGGGMVDSEKSGASGNSVLTVEGNATVAMNGGTANGEIIGGNYVRGNGEATVASSSVTIKAGTFAAKESSTNQAQYIVGGSKAMAYEGDIAKVTTNGLSEVIVGEVDGEDFTITDGAVVGGSVSKATGSGSATSEVASSRVTVNKGTLAGVIGGSLSETYSTTTGSASSSVGEGSAVIINGGTINKIEYGAVVGNAGMLDASVVGGSVANGTDTSATVASTDVRILGGTINDKVVAGSAAGHGGTVTVEGDTHLVMEKGTAGDLVGGNLVDGGTSKESNVLGSTYVTFSGGTVAGDIMGGSYVRNAAATSIVKNDTHVTVSGTVAQSQTQNWVENVFGGGKAMTNAIGQTATSNVDGTAYVTVQGDANIQVGLVAGGGMSRLQETGGNATATVNKAVVTVEGGTLAGVAGGGIAENRTGSGNTNTSSATVGESELNITGGIINAAKYGNINREEATVGIAVIGGGIAWSGNSSTTASAESVVEHAVTNISNDVIVKGDVVAAGLAHGKGTSLGGEEDASITAELNMNGGTVEGDVFAGAAVIANEELAQKGTNMEVAATINAGTVTGNVYAGNYTDENNQAAATGADIGVEIGSSAEVQGNVQALTAGTDILIREGARINSKNTDNQDVAGVQVASSANNTTVTLVGDNAAANVTNGFKSEATSSTLAFANFTGANDVVDFEGFSHLEARDNSVVTLGTDFNTSANGEAELTLTGDGTFKADRVTASSTNALTVGDGATSTTLEVAKELTTGNSLTVTNMGTLSVAQEVVLDKTETGYTAKEDVGTTTVNGGGTYEITGIDTLSMAEAQSIKTALQSNGSTGMIYLAGASISDLKTNGHGHYDYATVSGVATVDDLLKGTVDVTSAENTGISGGFKNVHLTDTTGPLVAMGGLTLAGGDPGTLLVMTGTDPDYEKGELRIGSKSPSAEDLTNRQNTVVTFGQLGADNYGIIGDVTMNAGEGKTTTLNVVGDGNAVFEAGEIQTNGSTNNIVVNGAHFVTKSVSVAGYKDLDSLKITNGGSLTAHGIAELKDVSLAGGTLSAKQTTPVEGEATDGNIIISGSLSGYGRVEVENTLTFSNGLTTTEDADLILEGPTLALGELDSTVGKITIVATENLTTDGGATLNDDVVLAQNWTLASGDNVTARGDSMQLVSQFTEIGQTPDSDGKSSLNTTYTIDGQSQLVHMDVDLDNEADIEELRAELGKLRAELDRHEYTGPAYLTDKTLDLTSTGKLVVGTDKRTEPNTDRVVFGENSVLIVDADIDKDAVFTATDASAPTLATAYVDDTSKLYVENATAKSEITIFGEGFNTVEVNAEDWTNIQTDTAMLKGTYEDNKAKFEVRDAMTEFPGLSEDLAPAVNELYQRSLNDVDSDYMGVRFLSRATNDNYLGRKDRAAAASTIESAARMAFAGAVPQMTKMASDSATNSVVNRMGFANPENGAKAMNVDGKLVDDKALGLALWIAPLWSNQTGFGMEAGNLDYGYNANIGGISLGADYTWANNFRAGLMFNIGGGYAESSGDLSETTNSMTFWGVGAYGGWKYENFAVMGDVSYTSTWNSVDQDVDHRMEMGDLEADIQASAISAGLRFEYKLETQYLDLIPHVGARYMSINTWGYDVETNGGTVLEGDGFQQNIWTFPVGITFSKELEMNNDWYFKPSVDFTVIPAAGDIKAKEDVRFTGMPISTEIETQMMDYFTWQGGLGLEFGNDNMSVGVNYTLQAGQNSTGHGVFGMFRYEF